MKFFIFALLFSAAVSAYEIPASTVQDKNAMLVTFTPREKDGAQELKVFDPKLKKEVWKIKFPKGAPHYFVFNDSPREVFFYESRALKRMDWKVGAVASTVWELPKDVAPYIHGEAGSADPKTPKLYEIWFQTGTDRWRISTLLEQKDSYLMKIFEFSKGKGWTLIAQSQTKGCYGHGNCGVELKEHQKAKIWSQELGYEKAATCCGPPEKLWDLHVPCESDFKKSLELTTPEQATLKLNLICSPGMDDETSIDFAGPVEWTSKDHKTKKELFKETGSQIFISRHGQNVLIQETGSSGARLYDLRDGSVIFDFNPSDAIAPSVYWTALLQ